MKVKVSNIFVFVLNSCLCAPVLKSGSFYDIWNDSVSLNSQSVKNNSDFLWENSLLLKDAEIFNNSAENRLGKVLNFFPVPVEEECLSKDGRRKGVCMNVYECRIQGGKSSGQCALGFGVCCLFTASCGQEVLNNITYFVNPDFPDLSRGMTNCSLTIKKIDPEIAQIKLEFIHFNLGQPNRKTGICDEDSFVLKAETKRELKMCGLNSGQHVYFEVEDTIDEPITIFMNLSGKTVFRLWEIRIEQIPFTQRAPAGCLQYHTGSTGLIQTMNFAENGRHLANQDYNICIRQENEMCSIVYEPCHENAFRISPNSDHSTNILDDEPGSGDGSGVISGRKLLNGDCVDKITLPCDNEDFLMIEESGPVFCGLVHCGGTLCPPGVFPCKIESTATPFTVGVHFGDAVRDESPDDNLGMCLMYEQQLCNI